MSRWVVPSKSGTIAATSGEAVGNPDVPGGMARDEGDGLGARIAKYIPGEVLTGFTVALSGLVSLGVGAEWRQMLAVVLILVFLAVTIGVVARYAPSGVVRRAHFVVMPIAFLAWSYPISSAVLGNWFFPPAAFVLQLLVLACSYFVKPMET